MEIAQWARLSRRLLSRRTYGHNVASMAWGRNIWFPHRSDDDDDDDDWICMRFFIFIGMWVVIVVLLSISISVCCFSCPRCPAYRYGPKDAAAAPVSPAAQPQKAQPAGGDDPAP